MSVGEAAEVFHNNPLDLGCELFGHEPRWDSVGHTDRLRILRLADTLRSEAVPVITGWEIGRRLQDWYSREKK